MVVLAWLGIGTASAGQLGDLISPGPLSRAHATVKGGMTCTQCHEAGRRVTTPKCLTCHAPIAQRIAAKTGVHRAVTDCVSCHVEHVGTDADLRHFDTRRFNHAAETRFPLDGQHARVATTCVACHKTRSFLTAQSTCVSCHADPHKGSLGTTCTTCHSTAAPFKAARTSFDHAGTRFPLTGRHRDLDCAKCHATATFASKGFASCTACHQDPHQKKFGATCTSCHGTAGWTTRSVDHAKTDFPLKGAHLQVPCAQCHPSGEMTRAIRADTCASCHVDVHRGAFKEDCRSCHSEAGFAGATFDHRSTGFALDGGHVSVKCASCHADARTLPWPAARRSTVRSVAFSGLSRGCVSCHGGEKDPHKGAFGTTCETCHQTRTFDVKAFRHPRMADFFAGEHQPLTCDGCHLRGVALPALRQTAPLDALARLDASRATASPGAPAPTMPSLACVSCHRDPHLGQVSTTCETCHDVGGTKFRAVRFSHAATPFPLTGKHADVMCAQCHRTETRAFPAGTGAAMVLHPDGGGTCVTCHQDPHLGQVGTACERCHGTSTFTVTDYTHAGMQDFFGGVHGRYACAACHTRETGTFPAGRGTAVRFLVGRSCADCHRGF